MTGSTALAERGGDAQTDPTMNGSNGAALDPEVVVVGGGPAGSAAAITLARAGRRVVLVDKATFPRDKCCGDGLTALALRLLERLGLDPASVPSWQPVHEVVLHSPAGRPTTLPLPDDGLFSVVARRIDLDAALLALAASAGVEVRTGVAVTAADADATRVVLTLDDGTSIASPFVVAADGMWSPLRKFLGATHPGQYRGEWHAFRQYFTDVSDDAATRLHVWFEPDLLPGYAWSFPLPDKRANVGFGLPRGEHLVGADFKRLWADLLERPAVRAVLGPDARPEAPHRAWPIPARVDRVALSAGGGRVLFAGDAACATDPMTGEGIGQALLTGMVAAEAIVDHGDEPARAADRYEATVHAELARDHHFAEQLMTVLGRRAGCEWSLRAVDLSPWTRRNFARWMFEDYPRALLLTPRRWHRGMFAGPGAYANQGAGA